MPSERDRKLNLIAAAIKEARKVSRNARYGGLSELDSALQAAVHAIEWLEAYPDTLIEQLAALEHHQWVEWSKLVMPEVSEETRERWKKLQVPYHEVPITHKPSDRAWAKEVIDIFKSGWADLRTRE